MSLLTRIVDLREGEARPAVLTGLVLALLVGGHTILETARDALFLSKLPAEQLTLVYVLLAFLSLISASASTAFARRFGRRTALVFSLLASAYLVVVVWLRPPTSALVFGFYVLSGVMGTVLTLQFWMFAGEQFTVAQGKRLFGPIAAGGVVGATVGASLAAALMRFFPVGLLLVVGAAAFVATAAVLAGVPTDDARGADRGAGKGGAFAWLKDVGVVVKDGYVKLLAAAAGLGTAAVLVVDYLFKSVAAREIPMEDLGAFFATYYAIQNGVSLIVQVAVAGFVLRRFGVVNAVLGLPALLLIAATGILVAGQSLVAVIGAKGADGALRHSLHRVSNELLFLPMPSDLRDRAKPVIDTVFGRGVQAVTAGAILALGAMGWATPRVLGGVVVALSLAWGVTALMVRRPYVDLFRKALSLGQIEPTGRGDLDLASVEALMESLSSREEERVLAALDVLVDSGRSRLVPGLILYHENPKVLERALAVLPAPGRRDWIPLAERLQEHASAAVRAGAVRALASAGVTEAVARALEDASEVVRAYALFFLAQGRDAEQEPLGDRRIIQILDAEGPDGVRGRGALLGVIGEHGDARWTGVVAEVLARDRKRGLDAALAAAAIERVRDPSFIPYLVSLLGSRDGRTAVREALVEIGAPAFAAVVSALRDPKTDSRIRLHLPRTISRFGTQEAVDVLTERLAKEENGAVRFKILRGLGRLATDASKAASSLRFDRAAFETETMRNLQEHLRLSALRLALREEVDGEALRETSGGLVLVGLLEDKVRQSLERAFRCLNIAHRHEDIHGVYAALKSSDKRARANALEFLDALPLRIAGLREVLRVVVDDLPPAERIRRAAGLVQHAAPAGPLEAIRRLLDDPDPLLAALAGYHALDLGVIALHADVDRVFDARPELRELGGRKSVAPLPPPPSTKIALGARPS